MNSLLLADEFRVKVMEDALKMGLQAKTPSDWEWERLWYPTQSVLNVFDSEKEQQNQMIIKNLDQLKRLNQMDQTNGQSQKEILVEKDENRHWNSKNISGIDNNGIMEREDNEQKEGIVGEGNMEVVRNWAYIVHTYIIYF